MTAKFALGMLFAWMVAASVVAAAESGGRTPMREFAGFITDAETSRGLWGEAGAVWGRENDLIAEDIDVLNAYTHVSYGQEKWELGLLGQYASFFEPIDESGAGDMFLWGKFLPVRTDIFTFGGGLSLLLPVAEEGFGIDEFGVQPFLTGAIAAGPVSLRSSVGYNFVPEFDGDADSLNYTAGVLAPFGGYVDGRLELIGAHLPEADVNSISLVPGIDVHVPLNGLEIILRPTAAVGLTDETPDYQFGFAFALAQSP